MGHVIEYVLFAATMFFIHISTTEDPGDLRAAFQVVLLIAVVVALSIWGTSAPGGAQ